MQDLTKKLVLGIAIALACGPLTSSAQIYVSVHPRHDIVVRTAQPSPRHVWVDEDWRARHGHYEYNGGRWEAPPREGAQYHPGHWRESPRGSVWVGGRWR